MPRRPDQVSHNRRRKAEIDADRRAAARLAPRLTAPCAGCGRPSVTLYCDACAPPLRSADPTGDRRWNGEILGHFRDYRAARAEPKAYS